MSVVECDVPRHSALGKDLIERADFLDAYRAPLSRSDRSVVEIFFAIFAYREGQRWHSPGNQVCTGLPAGGKEIRTLGPLPRGSDFFPRIRRAGGRLQ
jgi:hypothetical protein